MPKKLLQPITACANSTNQSKFVAIQCNLIKAQEKLCVQVEIGFGFSSHWLINRRDIFKPITKHSNKLLLLHNYQYFQHLFENCSMWTMVHIACSFFRLIQPTQYPQENILLFLLK